MLHTSYNTGSLPLGHTVKKELCVKFTQKSITPSCLDMLNFLKMCFLQGRLEQCVIAYHRGPLQGEQCEDITLKFSIPAALSYKGRTG